MSEESSCLDEVEEQARCKLAKACLEYYSSGACAQLTRDNNRAAFQRLRICPRVLRDVSSRDMSIVVQGRRLNIPIGVAPTAMQKMAHPEGECANARGTSRAGALFVLSTMSNCTIEEVASATPGSLKWFQLYLFQKREETVKLVRRAEAVGFGALVLTVDTSAVGKRYADKRNCFALPSHLKLANFTGELASGKIADPSSGAALADYSRDVLNLNPMWEDVAWLKRLTKLPVVLKGILTPEDARIAADIGVFALIVSNHGGRQLDTVPATIEILPEIAKAVGDRVEIYLDGGIRYGTDVFKALALGAKMVFIGRPAVWGLACNGEKGVKKVLDILSHEFDTALALAGCRSISDVTKDMVIHESSYSKL